MEQKQTTTLAVFFQIMNDWIYKIHISLQQPTYQQSLTFGNPVARSSSAIILTSKNDQRNIGQLVFHRRIEDIHLKCSAATTQYSVAYLKEMSHWLLPWRDAKIFFRSCSILSKTVKIVAIRFRF